MLTFDRPLTQVKFVHAIGWQETRNLRDIWTTLPDFEPRRTRYESVTSKVVSILKMNQQQQQQHDIKSKQN